MELSALFLETGSPTPSSGPGLIVKLPKKLEHYRSCGPLPLLVQTTKFILFILCRRFQLATKAGRFSTENSSEDHGQGYHCRL